MTTVLVVEDDDNIARLYETVLKKAFFNVSVADNGVTAFNCLEENYIDVIVTDVMMPEMDGFEFVEALRDTGYDMPVLMITAKDTFEDKKKGFRIGIDDYMVKPIDVDEMVLRIEALLRRAKIAHSEKLVVGSTELDHVELSITYDGKTVMPPNKEFLLLYKLLSYPNKIFTRHQLMDEVWGVDTDSEERTVDVHIKRLRQKLSDSKDFQIVTIRGLGYKVVLTNED